MSARRKRGSRRTPKGRLRLQDRDLGILEWVGRAGVVELADIAALYWSSGETGASRAPAARRVRLLVDHGLLEVGVRALHESNRVRLTPLGADRLGRIAPQTVLRTRIRVTSAAADHLITSARVWACLARRLASCEHLRLLQFLTEQEIRRVLIERTGALIPDGIAMLGTGEQPVTAIAVEVDLDNELARVVGHKAERYGPHLARGIPLYGVDLHAVVVVAPGRRRLEQLAAAVGRTEAAAFAFFLDLENLSARTVLDHLATTQSLLRRNPAPNPFTTSLLGGI